MALSFLNGLLRKKRAQMMAVDLGERTTKAVLLERRGELLALTRFVLLDTPIYERKISSKNLPNSAWIGFRALRRVRWI